MLPKSRIPCQWLLAGPNCFQMYVEENLAMDRCSLMLRRAMATMSVPGAGRRE